MQRSMLSGCHHPNCSFLRARCCSPKQRSESSLQLRRIKLLFLIKQANMGFSCVTCLVCVRACRKINQNECLATGKCVHDLLIIDAGVSTDFLAFLFGPFLRSAVT